MPEPQRYTICLSNTAQAMLKGTNDARVRAIIAARIDQLTEDPEKQGKPLTGDLIGYRSVRAVGQRYRIIYQVQESRVVVAIVALGLRKEGNRKDIFALAQRLFQQGLLNPSLEEPEEAE